MIYTWIINKLRYVWGVLALVAAVIVTVIGIRRDAKHDAQMELEFDSHVVDRNKAKSARAAARAVRDRYMQHAPDSVRTRWHRD